jgi:hypothetical protein
MTRLELKEAFLANPYLVSLATSMEYVKDPNVSEINLPKIFDQLMDLAFQDTTLTSGYLEQMQNDDFSNATIDDRFGVYLRNCLREDLGSTFEQ